MRYQINVSAPVLARNRTRGTKDPAIIIRDYRATGDPYTMAQAVRILGPATVTGTGTSAWVETDADLELSGAVPGLDERGP